jgi:DHA2 family multidrug resistance protein
MLAVGYWGLGHLPMHAGFSTFIPLLIETGIGTGCSMVILSTVSLSSMAPANMTAAAGLYTLVRRVSGNIAYAVLATLLERRSQIHRAILSGNISNLSSATRAYTDSASSRLMSFGYSSPTLHIRELAMANGVLDRQSTMMAYDDAFTLLFWLFALTIPLTILLPRRGIPEEST